MNMKKTKIKSNMEMASFEIDDGVVEVISISKIN